MTRILRVIDEPTPGDQWAALFHELWPAYRRWYFREGISARPTYRECSHALAASMPELFEVYERLLELLDASDLQARFLALYRPPTYVFGCSQMVRLEPEPMLVRNYDYLPQLWEAVLVRTSWTGAPTLAMSDCVWGALDGMNAGGLAVSLAFGGEREVQDGFGMPLILRYVLEVARDTQDAIAALRAVPSHMAYNVTIVDAKGDYATVFTRPHDVPLVERLACVTNHRPDAPVNEYALRTKSVERATALARLLEQGSDASEVVGAFLSPPLYTESAPEGWGTLYTTVYRPWSRTVEVRRAGIVETLSVDGFRTGPRGG